MFYEELKAPDMLVILHRNSESNHNVCMFVYKKTQCTCRFNLTIMKQKW